MIRKRMAYGGLIMAYIGCFMALYSNLKQPQFDYAQGTISIILLLLTSAGSWLLIIKRPFDQKSSGETKKDDNAIKPDSNLVADNKRTNDQYQEREIIMAFAFVGLIISVVLLIRYLF